MSAPRLACAGGVSPLHYAPRTCPIVHQMSVRGRGVPAAVFRELTQSFTRCRCADSLFPFVISTNAEKSRSVSDGQKGRRE